MGNQHLATPRVNARSELSELYQQCEDTGFDRQTSLDPSQIIDNLRLERYTGSRHTREQTILASDAIRETYYALRPLLGVSIRKHLQRLFLRSWEELPFPHWPVDTTVEHIFETLLWLSMKAQRIERIPFIWFWPEGASSCAIVTHDVETKSGHRLCFTSDGYRRRLWD